MKAYSNIRVYHNPSTCMYMVTYNTRFGGSGGRHVETREEAIKLARELDSLDEGDIPWRQESE